MTLTPNQARAVAQVAGRCQGYRTVIVGASALGFYCDMTWRKTADVDLVIAIEMEDFPFGIDALEGWQRGNKEHEFCSAEGVKIDIIPAGPALLVRGQVAWPSGHTMNLTGIDLALQHAEAHEAHGVEVAVASPCVIAVLKIAPYLDRPAERLRDLAHLAHLIDIYEQDSDRYWDEALDQEDYELKAPYLLGIDIGTIAHDDHRALIDTFLERVGDEDSVDHAQMTLRGPPLWTLQVRAL
ncbi:MAG: hypothetical protein KAI47_11535, partial [Deltaproteobacteria bacterium]|nr:hypothetical protein [Deltaproteobacteria bacterium]